MKQSIALILFLILPLFAKAQNAYTINCLSNDFANDEFTLVSSVGNPISDFIETGNDQGNEFILGFVPLNQGFIISGVLDDEKFLVQCYPNPVSAILNIIDTEGAVKNITVIDMHGRVVKSGEVDSYSIDLSSLKSGFYIVHFMGWKNELLKTAKIIKI